jgi:hypothetical protein
MATADETKQALLDAIAEAAPDFTGSPGALRELAEAYALVARPGGVVGGSTGS